VTPSIRMDPKEKDSNRISASLLEFNRRAH
jgi:hypothetical protein